MVLTEFLISVILAIGVLNIPNGLFGDNGLFKTSAEDGQILSAAGQRMIPVNQTVDTNTHLNWDFTNVPAIPATTGDDDTVGSATWSNTGNITAADETYATVALFGAASTIFENSVKLIKAGGIAGSERATGAFLTGTNSFVIYGGAGDKWGTTWTPAQINAANFGVGFSAKATTSGTISHYLTATNFGFAIPTDATVTGIEVFIKQKAQVGTPSGAWVDYIGMRVYYLESS